MFKISNISIEGFWDSYGFELNPPEDVYFLIGQNGTGKTTLINLIAAVLTADFRSLDTIPFSQVKISLSSNEQQQIPLIQVSKSRGRGEKFSNIKYSIYGGKKGEKPLIFNMREMYDDRFSPVYYDDPTYMRHYYNSVSNSVIPELRRYVNLNWLSIHRIQSFGRAADDGRHETSIDAKLESISNSLVRYFATFSNQKDIEVREFQQSLFLSLLDQADASPFSMAFQDNEDKNKEALKIIFRELGVPHHRYEDMLSLYYVKSVDLKNKMSNGTPLDIHDVGALVSKRKIGEIINQWEELQGKLRQIFTKRDNFIDICNNLFYRKKVEITSSNELRFTSRSGKNIPVNLLSSGEKQLLILLSETLLQDQKPSVFIADEPELSLHVKWQEKLVSSLRALNPNAQIIFATHSPDIVGRLVGNVIDMETLVP